MGLDEARHDGGKQRIRYMDAARSVLILIGVLLHASNLYRIDSTWIVVDTDQHSIYTMVWAVIHAFRMPAFFFISGYFFALTLRKYGAAKLLGIRLPRIVIPTVVVALLFNVPQAVLIDQSRRGIGLVMDPAFWIYGAWVSHLWFLVYLALYFAFTAAISRPFVRLVDYCEKVVAGKCGAFDGLLMFLLLAAAFLTVFGVLQTAVTLQPRLYQEGLLGVSGYRLGWFYIFFMTGFVAQASRPLFGGIQRWGWISFVIGGALWLLQATTAPDSLPWRGIASLTQAILTLGYVVLTMAFFQRLFNHDSRVWRYLSDASYTIYLVHHVVVVGVGYYLLGFPFPHWAKFLLVCASSVTLSLAFHHFLVLRFSLMRFLFNGHYDNRRRPNADRQQPSARQ